MENDSNWLERGRPIESQSVRYNILLTNDDLINIDDDDDDSTPASLSPGMVKAGLVANDASLCKLL